MTNTTTYTRFTVRRDLGTVHAAAKERGVSLTHIIGGVALQAKLQGTKVYFYLDGQRVSRLNAEDRLTQAKYDERKARTEGIKAINTDTSVLTQGFHTGGYVGQLADRHREAEEIVRRERMIPPGRYDATLTPTPGKPESFDIVVLGVAGATVADAAMGLSKAVGMIGRTVLVCAGAMRTPKAGLHLYEQFERRIERKEPKPKRNNGPRNRWGKLV